MTTNFDRDLYFEKLTARRLGHVVVYADVVKSTMDVFEG